MISSHSFGPELLDDYAGDQELIREGQFPRKKGKSKPNRGARFGETTEIVEAKNTGEGLRPKKTSQRRRDAMHHEAWRRS